MVEAANDTGVKIAGRWYNYSKFDEVAHPQLGQLVELTLNKGRWIRGLAVAGELVTHREAAEASRLEPPEAPAPLDHGDPLAGREPTPEAAAPPTALGAPVYTVHAGDPLLRRLSVLRSATEFHAGRAKATDADVLSTADRFLEWLEQPHHRPPQEEDTE